MVTITSEPSQVRPGYVAWQWSRYIQVPLKLSTRFWCRTCPISSERWQKALLVAKRGKETPDKWDRHHHLARWEIFTINHVWRSLRRHQHKKVCNKHAWSPRLLFSAKFDNMFMQRKVSLKLFWLTAMYGKTKNGIVIRLYLTSSILQLIALIHCLIVMTNISSSPGRENQQGRIVIYHILHLWPQTPDSPDSLEILGR